MTKSLERHFKYRHKYYRSWPWYGRSSDKQATRAANGFTMVKFTIPSSMISFKCMNFLITKMKSEEQHIFVQN